MKRSKVRLVGFRSVIGSAVALLIVLAPELVIPDTISVLPSPEGSKFVAVHNATAQDNIVSGELRNASSHRVRDVELLIRHIWHWNDEFRPGENSPGAADFYTISTEIPSGATERFTYRMPTPLPVRADGYFETVVTVAGFTEIKEEMQERKNVDDWRPVS
jgi:hypothetical protein